MELRKRVRDGSGVAEAVGVTICLAVENLIIHNVNEYRRKVSWVHRKLSGTTGRSHYLQGVAGMDSMMVTWLATLQHNADSVTGQIPIVSDANSVTPVGDDTPCDDPRLLFKMGFCAP